MVCLLSTISGNTEILAAQQHAKHINNIVYKILLVSVSNRWRRRDSATEPSGIEPPEQRLRFRASRIRPGGIDPGPAGYCASKHWLRATQGQNMYLIA
jgi:hypothetical protein